jgi:dTDP-glucose 4,6-dehydratase
MKLLVMGGLGFIGSNFIRFMLDEHDNCTIVNVDAKMFGSNAENLKDFGRRHSRQIQDTKECLKPYRH